jgi:hypothetical protein
MFTSKENILQNISISSENLKKSQDNPSKYDKRKIVYPLSKGIKKYKPSFYFNYPIFYKNGKLFGFYRYSDDFLEINLLILEKKIPTPNELVKKMDGFNKTNDFQPNNLKTYNEYSVKYANKINQKDTVGMITKLEEISKSTDDFKPSKFVMMALMKSDVSIKHCDGSIKALTFAQEIKSS